MKEQFTRLHAMLLCLDNTYWMVLFVFNLLSQ